MTQSDKLAMLLENGTELGPLQGGAVARERIHDLVQTFHSEEIATVGASQEQIAALPQDIAIEFSVAGAQDDVLDSILTWRNPSLPDGTLIGTVVAVRSFFVLELRQNPIRSRVSDAGVELYTDGEWIQPAFELEALHVNETRYPFVGEEFEDMAGNTVVARSAPEVEPESTSEDAAMSDTRMYPTASKCPRCGARPVDSDGTLCSDCSADL